MYLLQTQRICFIFIQYLYLSIILINNSKVSKNSAKIDGNIGGAVKKKTKKQIIPNSGKIEKNQENKKLVVDLDLLDPKLFSSLQGN